ncbi:adenosine deaminase [Clostridium chrysemydis]|uniref:adenosine deaminase n=1 Tax=Clostridium chrysemydis TaxID=2665504 RepID=UPI00188411E6|nr:adenosine deaminase [Clostridium chrysemydis]
MYKNLPKIELHCHLDGCLRVETVIELLNKEGLNEEIRGFEEMKERLIVPNDCPSLNVYLERFDLPLKVMQNKENLERIAFELIEDVNKENVKYIEVRFAPLFHKEKGLKVDEIIASVLKGLKRGEKEYGVKSNLILSLLRHMGEDTIYEVLDGGKEFIGKGVVAIDLAGGEELNFCKKFKRAFDYGRSLGYKVTIHAGETGHAINVKEAIELLGAERIGHAVAIENDSDIYNLVKENNIVLEMCPTSNVQTKAVTEYKNHPVKKFLESGLLVNVSTDNRTVSDVTLTEECEEINKNHVLNLEDYKKIYLNSLKGAFCDEYTKEELLKLASSI